MMAGKPPTRKTCAYYTTDLCDTAQCGEVVDEVLKVDNFGIFCPQILIKRVQTGGLRVSSEVARWPKKNLCRHQNGSPPPPTTAQTKHRVVHSTIHTFCVKRDTDKNQEPGNFVDK